MKGFLLLGVCAVLLSIYQAMQTSQDIIVYQHRIQSLQAEIASMDKKLNRIKALPVNPSGELMDNVTHAYEFLRLEASLHGLKQGLRLGQVSIDKQWVGIRKAAIEMDVQLDGFGDDFYHVLDWMDRIQEQVPVEIDKIEKNENRMNAVFYVYGI